MVEYLGDGCLGRMVGCVGFRDDPPHFPQMVRLWRMPWNVALSDKLCSRTVGIAAVSVRHYIEWFVQLQRYAPFALVKHRLVDALYRYIALSAWSIACYVSFQPLITIRLSQELQQEFPESASTLSLILKIL